MNQPTSAFNVPAVRREIFIHLNGVDYTVEIGFPREESSWVTIRQYDENFKFWKFVWSESCPVEGEPQTDLDIIRYAFRTARRRMRGWVNSWAESRHSAAQEKGGKKSYYTKWANRCREQFLRYAAQWKLCKAIWKEITKL